MSALAQAGHALIAERPSLSVHALIADFTAELVLPETPGPRLVAFLGGTIGNLLPAERKVFLASVRALLSPATPCCSARISSRTRRCWSGPTTTRRA